MNNNKREKKKKMTMNLVTEQREKKKMAVNLVSSEPMTELRFCYWLYSPFSITAAINDNEALTEVTKEDVVKTPGQCGSLTFPSNLTEAGVLLCVSTFEESGRFDLVLNSRVLIIPRSGLAIGATMAPVVCVLVWICFPVGFPISKLLDFLLAHGHLALFCRAELKTLVDLHGNGWTRRRIDT